MLSEPLVPKARKACRGLLLDYCGAILCALPSSNRDPQNAHLLRTVDLTDSLVRVPCQLVGWQYITGAQVSSVAQ